jgi:hypothetical protein
MEMNVSQCDMFRNEQKIGGREQRVWLLDSGLVSWQLPLPHDLRSGVVTLFMV